MIRLLRYLLVVVVFVLVNVAATGTSQANAIAFASAFGVILALTGKYIPAVGHRMVGIVVVLSFVLAIVAEVASKEISLSNLQSTDPAHLLTAFLSVWGLSQFLFATLTQSTKTAKAVT